MSVRGCVDKILGTRGFSRVLYLPSTENADATSTTALLVFGGVGGFACRLLSRVRSVVSRKVNVSGFTGTDGPAADAVADNHTAGTKPAYSVSAPASRCRVPKPRVPDEPGVEKAIQL